MQNQNKLLKLILDNVQIGIWLIDIKDNIILTNKYYDENIRITEAENLICKQTDDELLAQGFPTQYYEEKLTYADERVHTLQIVKTKIFAEDGTLFGILGIGIDITERKRIEENIRYLSYHDQLTGLHNRRFYDEEILRLDDACSLPLTLLLADMDGLKLANDLFGHQEGDALLQRFADILKRVCRKEEIIARLGGDEFIIILPKTSTSQAGKIAQRIKGSMSGVKVGSSELSASLGWATKSREEQCITDIFLEAERMMYVDKANQGANCR